MSFKNNGSGEGRVKGKNPEWLPPTADENNKRVIYGKPYTWNGRKSWILDDTPDSGLRPPSINMNDDSSIPSQIPSKDDDATIITQETGLSLDKQNEIRRLQANLTNMTASLASILKQEGPIAAYCDYDTSLLKCIRDVHKEFLLFLLLHLMWLCTCVNVIIGLTLRTIIDCICYLITNSLYCFIERIIVPNITVDGFFDTLIWFLAPPNLLINLISPLLSTFYNCKTKFHSSSTFGNCSSGRHGKRGRFTDRHNTWWHGSTYQIKSRRQSRHLLRTKEREIRCKIDLLQYFDPIIIPPDIYVINDDVFYDAAVLDSWLSDDICVPSIAVTLLSINLLIDSVGVISHYKQLQRYWNVSFLNTSYRQLDPSSTQFSSILIQARHLQAQIFRYDTTLANINNTPLIYVSSNNKELPIVIDTDASSSITPIASDFTSIIGKADVQELKQVNGTTPVCGQGIVEWPIEDVQGVRRSIITEAYFVPDAGIRLFSPQTYIGKNKTSMHMYDSDGVRFTLKCGTVLRFLFNNSNNLPLMLTQATHKTHKNSHLLERPDFVK
jgi:hypothetical protein